MRKWSLLLQGLLLVGLIAGCGARATNPTDTGNPGSQDTSGGNLDTMNYGAKFFQSSPTTKWIVSGPVRVSNGVILADNQSADTANGSCRYDGMVDFGNSADVYFLWKGGPTNGGIITLLKSNDGSIWGNVPCIDNGAGWKAGPNRPGWTKSPRA